MRKIGLFSVLLLGISSSAVMAQQAAVKADEVSKPDSAWAGFVKDSPEWLSRVYGEASFETDSEPRMSVETVQPLYRTDDDHQTVFTQGRIAFGNDVWTGNIGAGYRYLTEDYQNMFGENIFYDRQFGENHERIGFGFEWMNPYLTFRTNAYETISDWKLVGEVTNGVIEEKSMSGRDLELEGAVPYLPWARIAGGYYQWDSEIEGSNDINGYRTRINMDLLRNVALETGYANDDAGNSFFANIKFALGPVKGEKPTAISSGIGEKAFEARNLREHTLDRVERHNDIVTEQRTRAVGNISGVRVSIRRAN